MNDYYSTFNNMKRVSIIKSKAQYFAYCDEVEQLELMETKSKEVEDRIELLILLIEKWGKEHNELPALNPVGYLKLLMETNDLKNVDLQNKVGINKTTLSHILNYRRGFSKKNIRLLADFFKVSQDTFNKKYELKNGRIKKVKPQSLPTKKDTTLKRRKAMA